VRSNKKKMRVGENGGLNQSKHEKSTIQVTRFFFIRSYVTLHYGMADIIKKKLRFLFDFLGHSSIFFICKLLFGNYFFLYFSHILTFNVIFKCKYKYIGCSFKSILKVDDEELIVNAPLVSLQSKNTKHKK
jgi:hypothetical protein